MSTIDNSVREREASDREEAVDSTTIELELPTNDYSPQSLNPSPHSAQAVTVRNMSPQAVAISGIDKLIGMYEAGIVKSAQQAAGRGAAPGKPESEPDSSLPGSSVAPPASPDAGVTSTRSEGEPDLNTGRDKVPRSVKEGIPPGSRASSEARGPCPLWSEFGLHPRRRSFGVVWRFCVI